MYKGLDNHALYFLVWLPILAVNITFKGVCHDRRVLCPVYLLLFVTDFDDRFVWTRSYLWNFYGLGLLFFICVWVFCFLGFAKISCLLPCCQIFDVSLIFPFEHWFTCFFHCWMWLCSTYSQKFILPRVWWWSILHRLWLVRYLIWFKRLEISSTVNICQRFF